MFCTKCGKQIEQGTVCSECAAKSAANSYNPGAQTGYAQQGYGQTYGQQTNGQAYTAGANFYQPYTAPAQSPASDKNNKMLGFGKALTSTILSTFGLLFAYVADILFLALDVEAAMILSIFTMPLAIIPLIFGISSIKVFTSCKNSRSKPIATLILGINGLAVSAGAALIDIIVLLGAMALL
jgi:hypothetical protein